MFLLRNKKNIIWLPPLIWNYDFSDCYDFCAAYVNVDLDVMFEGKKKKKNIYEKINPQSNSQWVRLWDSILQQRVYPGIYIAQDKKGSHVGIYFFYFSLKYILWVLIRSILLWHF